MAKAMLIMDTPECCAKCDLCVLHSDYISLEYECRGAKISNGYVKVNHKINHKLLNKRQEWCPLREVPKKIDYASHFKEDLQSIDFSMGYTKGYNACIDKILNDN